MRKIIKLTTISEEDAKGHTIMKLEKGNIFITGNDKNGYDFKCGNCEETLAKNIFHEQIKNIVFICNSCKQYNIIKIDWKIYLLKQVKEKTNYPAIIIGFLLIIFIATKNDIPLVIKIVINILIFIISLNYKYLVHIFQENNNQ